MKCSQCDQKTKVVDSRQLVSKAKHNFTWRRLRCLEGHITYTYEVCEAISPIPEKIRYIMRTGEKKNVVGLKKQKRKKKPEPVHEGAMREFGLKVTKSSPEWLKKIALQLE